VTPTFNSHFSSASALRVPRLAVSLEATDKCGKTYWALMTAPDPVCVISNDIGTASIVALARKAGRRIYTMDLSVPPPPPNVKSHTAINQADWDEWKKAWDKHKSAVDAIIAEKSIRTLVDDTETEVWHLAELAYFGKLQGNQNLDVRTKLNADYQRVFWKLYNERPDLNIILIHKQGKEYKKEGAGKQADWTGGYEIKGYSGIGFLVDASLIMKWDTIRKDFCIRFADKAMRYGNPFELVGKSWYSRDEDYGFGYIAMEVFPETQETPEYWGL
jgi:hypothetical protein